MKKHFRYIIASLLALMMLLSLCSCAQTGINSTNGGLDLDYVGEATDQPEEEKPWYSWITDAFSFGKKETTTTPSQSKPDSVADFYSQGSSDALEGNKNSKTDQSTPTTPEEETGNTTAPTSGGKKDDSKKNDQKTENNDTPAPTPEQKPDSKKDTVTITIRCDTAVNNGMHLEGKWAGIVPASGVILPVTTVEIDEGDKVFDVLSYVCDKYKIHMSYRGGTGSGCYVEGINNLYEFDGGRWSGWMYCVNDWYPNYGCGVYQVKAGDVIEWNYTCDLGLDLDGTWWEGAEDWKKNNE